MSLLWLKVYSRFVWIWIWTIFNFLESHAKKSNNLSDWSDKQNLLCWIKFMFFFLCETQSSYKSYNMCALYFWSIFLSFPFFHFLYASNAIFQLSSRLVDVHRNYKTKYPCLFKNSLKCIFIEVFFKSTTLATTSKAIYSVDVKTKISIAICT